ncbi:MAG: hypothetical protein K1X42_05170 [Opitutaceae bacterium]|nr:hypothetical protein [Opitutaceae bacterium]
MKTQSLSLSLLSAALLLVPVRADEVVDNLKTGISAYESNNFTEALQAIDYAGQLIRQKKGAAVAAILPNAPSGWTAEEAEADATAGAFMGGMVSVKRSYNKGDAHVTIQIQSDSPLLQSMSLMFSNPAMIAGSGAKLETIKGQRVAVTFRNADKSGDIKAVVDGRYMVSIEGNGLSREDLVSFAGAMDFSKLAKLK